MLRVALGITLLACGGPSTTKAAQPTAEPRAATRDAGTLTLTSDEQFIANGREIVRRLIEIFTNGGEDCEKLAAGISTLSRDPIWPASVQYEDAHPDVKERFGAEQAEMGRQFAAVAGPAMTACAANQTFADALAKMR